MPHRVFSHHRRREVTGERPLVPAYQKKPDHRSRKQEERKMIPSALIYDAKLVNARSRSAATVRMNADITPEQAKVIADCGGSRTPCFYGREAGT